MSTCGFRGRGFARGSPRPNGPAGGFAGPRFPHPNFNPARPPPQRLPTPEKWGERPAGFLPWQAKNNFQHRPQFRGNLHFRPNGRGRMPNGRGMVRFSGPGRPPGPQFPVANMRLPMMPRLPFVNNGNTQEKTIVTPLPGSQEERQQKICETADKLKQKLSSITQEEITHFWENDLTGEQTNYASKQEAKGKGSKGVAELRHGPPELGLTLTDLRDIGRVNANKLEGEGCLEEIDLVDDFDNNVSRFESTNDEISVTYSKDSDVLVIPSTDTECLNPNATIEHDKSHKEATSEIPEVTLPYLVGSSETVVCTSADSSEKVGSYSHVLNGTKKDTLVISTQAACKNVPEIVHGQQLKQAKTFEEAQKDSSLSKKAAKSPSVLQTIPLHKQPLADVPSKNAWNDTLASTSSNKKDTIHGTTTTSGALTAPYACQPFSGLNYTDVQIPSGSGFCSKAHKELTSYAPRVPNSKYHWSAKGNNRFPIGTQNKPEHSHQMPALRPRMTTQQLNPVTFSPRPLSSPLVTNSVCSTDLPLNFDPAKPPPQISPRLRSNKGNMETPVNFNSRGTLPHIPTVGNTMTDSLPSFNHQDSLPNLYNRDDSLGPQQMYSPCGFLPEQSNMLTINPTESVPMKPVGDFNLDSTATNFVQLPSVPPSPHPLYMPNMQMNFPTVISNMGAEQVSHNLHPPACPPIEVPQIEAPPPLPEGLLSDSEIMDDQPEATINDGLEDMQEAMKFANQIMNMSEQMENSVDSTIPLPSAEPLLPKASPLNNESLEQPSLRITETPIEGENPSGEPKKNYAHVDEVTVEKTLEPENVESTNQNQDTDVPNTLQIDALMRPKIIFNLNSKSRRISIIDDWHHQNDEGRHRKAKATNQTSECKKVSRQPSASNTDNSKESDPKKKTLNKTYIPNNQDAEIKKGIGPKILNDTLLCRLSEKSRASLINVKTANNVVSQKSEKSKRGLKPVAKTAELSWKNRVISRFLKMSKNDICNMVNNSSLRKFDIAMKHLVKEKKSSLSLELRNTEDDKIKGYDQEEFMNQLNAMLDPSATVDITNLPTEFIHHLNEVLQLDTMPFETNNSIQSDIQSTEAKEPDSSTQAASGNIIVDESSLNSTDARVESINQKLVLNASKDETQSSLLQHKPSVSDIPKRTAQQSPLVTEENVNETPMKSQRLLFNAADLDNILLEVADKPKDCKKNSEESKIDPLKDNTTLQNQPSFNDEPVEFPQTDECNETVAMKRIGNPIINTTNVRPRKSTSEDRSTFKLGTCQRWSRKEREDLDAFRNLTKEEWEAKHGKEFGSGSSFGLRRCFSNTRTDSFRINQHHSSERQYLAETSARNPSPNPTVCESVASNPNRISNRNGFVELLRGKRSRSPSTSSSSTSSGSERDPVNSDVTKLLKVIKEKENIAKTKSINETIRDEVAAEIERKRKEKTKYKEKKGSLKHSKRRTERRGKHRKRTKDKKKKKESTSSSSASEDESGEEHRLLAEDEIKKEIVVKEEVLTSPEKTLHPNGVPIISGTAVRETHNIVEPVHVPQITEPTSELPPTAILSAGTCNNEQQKGRNPSPCVLLTLQPKTKAQLKQMPDTTNVDQQYKADHSCQATVPIKNVVAINCEANKAIEKEPEDIQAEAERLKPNKNEQSTVLDSAGRDNIALREGVMLPANVNSDKIISPVRSSLKVKNTKTQKIDGIPNSKPTPDNPKMPKLVPSPIKRDKIIKARNSGKQQKPLDSSVHTVTQNMSKGAKTIPKKIDINVYKERALQRRLREEGKLEESADTYSLIETIPSISTCNTIVDMNTDNSLTAKKNAEPCLPSASKDDSNGTELSVDSNLKDSQIPGTLASSTNLVRKNGSRKYTENLPADNISNSMNNALENNKLQSKTLTSARNGTLESQTKVECKSTEEPKEIPVSVGAEATQKVEFEQNKTKKPKIISVTVVSEAMKNAEFKKIPGKRQRRRNRKKSPNKSQDKNFNLSIERRTEASANDIREQNMVQEIGSQVGNKFDNVMPIEKNEVNENHSNENRIINFEEARNESVTNNPKTESPDYFDSITGNALHVLTPMKTSEAHSKYSEVEKEDRPIDVLSHTNDHLEESKELYFNTNANQDLTSCIEEEQILSTSPKTQCVTEAAPEIVSADICTAFIQQFSESNEPSEIQTKESSHNQLLSLEANLTKEEDTLQSKIHEAIIKHNTIESNGARSVDTNDDINADSKDVKEILVSHTSKTKELLNKYAGICNAISPESSSSPFAGFGREWYQDFTYNERISSLHCDEVDTQLPSPSSARPNPNLTENLLSEEPASLPRVTSELTIKTSLVIDGINARSIFNEETADTPSPSTKELSDNSNGKISLEQSCIRRECDLTLKNEISMDLLNRDSNSYHVASEYVKAEDDNIEQHPKSFTFREDTEQNSCDDDELSKLHPGNFTQTCIESAADHDYSSNHQHVLNNTTNVIDKEHYSRPTSNFGDQSATTVYTGDESQKNEQLKISLQEEHKEFDNTANPTESGDLLTDITNETSTVELITAPLEIMSMEHDSASNGNQDDQHEALDSSSCSIEVPKKMNVPTKAALKASGENVLASSATTSNNSEVTESNTFEDFKRNSLSFEVRDLSRANRAKKINPEADFAHTNDELSGGTDRNKVEGMKQTHDRTHKSAGKNAKQSKGEQTDELHKIKNKPDLKRKHSKKQNISEKTVSEALQSGLVQIGEPNTKESVMARMIEIDKQIHTLMTEKMKLYALLENDVLPSETTLRSVTPMPVNDEQCTPDPSVLASQLVQTIDVSAVLHQPVHKTNEPTAHHNVHSTSSVKRKASTRKEHSHRKRIALSYTSDEDDTVVSKKTVSSKDGVAESVESSSRDRSATPERSTEKKRHSEKSSHGDGGKSSRHKVSSDIKEEHSDRKLAKVHKPTSSDDTRRKTVSPNVEKKNSKKGHRDKSITSKSVSNEETDKVRRKSEVESDNNPSLISPRNDSNKHATDTHIPTHTRRESSSEKPQETKLQSARVTEDNVPRRAQTVKLSENVSGNELQCDAKKQQFNDTSLENKQTSSTRPVSDARTSEGLSIYSDESTWESFPKNAPDESNDQKKPNMGLALLEMSYKKEMAKSRKLKSLTRKRKKKHPESTHTVDTLTSDEEDMSLSILYKKKLKQKRNLMDSMDSKVNDSSNLDNQNNSQNLDEIINAVAEDRVQELYIEQQPELQEKSNNPETKMHTEISKLDCDLRETQNDSRLKLQTLAGETERLKDDTHILIGKDSFAVNITEKAAGELSLRVEQSIDLPTLQKSVDLSHNKINEDTHVDKPNSTIETHQDIEMPQLYPLNESSIDNNGFVAKSGYFPIEKYCAYDSADELPSSVSNSQESVCETQSVASCPEKVKVNKEPEFAPEELISCEESKFDKYSRKKKGELLLEESFKQQRPRRDSAQSTDTMTTDSNSGTNQDLSSRKYMKRKRKSIERSVSKRSKLTEENVKRIRHDIDACADSYPETDTEGKTSATPIEIKSLEKTSSKEIVSVASTSRKRSTSISKQHNSARKYSASAGGEDIQIVKQISSHKKQCDPRLYTQQLKDCEVRLVDSKYTLLKPNINPNVLRRYGISKINPYLENSQNTVENQILSLQSSHADPVPDTCTKQNTSLADGNLIKDTGEIQIIKNIAMQEDASRTKQRNIENEITLIRDRRPSSGDEVSVIPTRNLQTPIISLDSEVPDIEIVQEMNPAKTHSEDGSEATLSVIEPNDDEDRGRTKYTVHKGPILDIKVFGNTFLAASEDGTIYRYSQASNGILNIYKGHKAAVTCLYVYTVGLSDSTKAWMFSGSLDGTLRCYNITTGMHIRDAVDVGSPVQCLDEAWGIIFVGTKSGHVSRYYIKSGAVKGESIPFSDKSVLALKATNEGSRRVLIVASRNQPITIRDAQTGLFLRTISGQKSHTVYSLMRHNNLIYCGTSSTSIPVFDFTDGEEIAQYHAGVGIVCMRLYSDLLFAGCYDGNIYIFNTKDHRLICSTPGPGNMLLSMEIVDNKIIAGSKDRRLQSWQMPKQVRSLLLQVT